MHEAYAGFDRILSLHSCRKLLHSGQDAPHLTRSAEDAFHAASIRMVTVLLDQI